MSYHDFTQDELTRYAWLRAAEWPSVPGYSMMGIGALFLPFVNYWTLVVIILAINIVWSVVSRSFYSLLISNAAVWINKLKWITAPGVAIYALTHHDHRLAIAAITWPLVCMLIALVEFGGLQGINQDRILDYIESREN